MSKLRGWMFIVPSVAVAAFVGTAQAQQCAQVIFQPGGGSVSIAGATLFVDFLKSPASTQDWIDVDGDGFQKFPLDQLSDPYVIGEPLDTFFELHYRSVGSVNGYDEFVAAQTCNLLSTKIPSEAGLFNAIQWATQGVKNAPYAPGCDYLLADTDGDTWALAGEDNNAAADPGDPAGISTVDIAVLDVPGAWATRIVGITSALWYSEPGDLGYGDNPISASNVTTYFSKLPTLCRSCPLPGETLGLDCDPASDPDCVCLNTNTTRPDDSTIYDNSITWAPISVIGNRGLGSSTYAMTDLVHMFLTGRALNGENLAVATRSVGSGTRNGMMNTMGIDPSWGMGDNIDAEWATGSSSFLGPARRISNAGGSGNIEDAVRYSRLGIGYTGLAGASRAAADAASGQYEILDVIFDDRGGTLPVRSTIASALLNCDPDTGYQLGGPVTFVTRGSITQSDAGQPDHMENQVARLYLLNIVGSIEAFDDKPPTDQGSWGPADYLVSNFTLVQAMSCFPSDLANPTSFSSNPALNPLVQEVTLDASTTITPPFGSVNIAGPVPRRANVATPYADEATTGLDLNFEGAVKYAFRLSSGALAQIGLVAGNPAQDLDMDGIPCGTDPDETCTLSDRRLSQRNQVAGDFNNDAKRDATDIDAMMKAVQNPLDFEQDIVPAGGWPGIVGHMPENVVIAHVIGDFDGNGNFNTDDVRYFADGLALVGRGTAAKLDREVGFTSVDAAWLSLAANENYFDTVVRNAAGIPTGSYSAGDSRADIAGATPWAGAEPKGHDGFVDCADVAYVAANFGDFTNPNEAVLNALGGRLDLSADMNGDLVIDCVDVSIVLEIMGESNSAACGAIENCKARCLTDLNGDGQTDGGDLGILLSQWGVVNGSADFNGGGVDGSDYGILLAAWGPC